MNESVAAVGMAHRMTAHVIILGCGRSGTSIFGELFDHLKPYTYYSEPPFSELLKLDFSQPIAVKVPKESPAYPPTPGLSFPLPSLLTAVPDPKRIYWQVRHPLDAICSLRVGIANQWGHHPKPPDWESWLQRPLLQRCAHHWNYINSVGYRQVAEQAKVTCFEDMLREPLRFAYSICADIGLNSRLHQAELAQWAKRVQNTNNKDFIEAETSKNYSRPDHHTRIDRWKENLKPADIASISPMVSQTARQFGYRLAQND